MRLTQAATSLEPEASVHRFLQMRRTKERPRAGWVSLRLGLAPAGHPQCPPRMKRRRGFWQVFT